MAASTTGSWRLARKTHADQPQILYFGAFFVAIGAVLVGADLAAVEATTIRDALQLWPLAIVAIGLGLVLRRTELGLPAGLLAAAAPGLLLGGGFALAPRIAVDCDAVGAPSTVASQEGVFDGPARVSVASGCGSLSVSTAAGNAWHLQHAAAGQAPIIDASPRSLSIDAGGHRWWSRGDADLEPWRLTLPTTEIETLSFVVNAGEGQIALPGAQIGALDVTTNAGSTSLDASRATLASLTGTVNAGAFSIRLPNADVTGVLEVNAGALEVCVPETVGLRVHHEGTLSGISINGSNQTDSNWQSPNYASAAHRADLTIEVNLGGVEINPVGGCT